jgi:hypothetical protein
MLFNAAGLKPSRPVAWGTPVNETRPGIYVISLVANTHKTCGPMDVSYLPIDAKKRWVSSQPVIYVGRTRRSLLRRISEFYRHVHGNRSPHRGGQDVKLLNCPLWVYWCPIEAAVLAEQKMIEEFYVNVGSFPFANRMRGSTRGSPNATGM